MAREHLTLKFTNKIGVTAMPWYAQFGGDETPLADSIMDRIAYDSYKINIRAKDPKNDRSMREVYGIRLEERQ